MEYKEITQDMLEDIKLMVEENCNKLIKSKIPSDNKPHYDQKEPVAIWKKFIYINNFNLRQIWHNGNCELVNSIIEKHKVPIILVNRKGSKAWCYKEVNKFIEVNMDVSYFKKWEWVSKLFEEESVDWPYERIAQPTYNLTLLREAFFISEEAYKKKLEKLISNRKKEHLSTLISEYGQYLEKQKEKRRLCSDEKISPDYNFYTNWIRKL